MPSRCFSLSRFGGSKSRVHSSIYCLILFVDRKFMSFPNFVPFKIAFGFPFELIQLRKHRNICLYQRTQSTTDFPFYYDQTHCHVDVFEGLRQGGISLHYILGTLAATLTVVVSEIISRGETRRSTRDNRTTQHRRSPSSRSVNQYKLADRDLHSTDYLRMHRSLQ